MSGVHLENYTPLLASILLVTFIFVFLLPLSPSFLALFALDLKSSIRLCLGCHKDAEDSPVCNHPSNLASYHAYLGIIPDRFHNPMFPLYSNDSTVTPPSSNSSLLFPCSIPPLLNPSLAQCLSSSPLLKPSSPFPPTSSPPPSPPHTQNHHANPQINTPNPNPHGKSQGIGIVDPIVEYAE
ncbi:hypothetical protein E4T43_05672 [Aureobasidium subglaciale]|nr:hypothetical protein E4T43_05672 [Aureobasidium subglaciale]